MNSRKPPRKKNLSSMRMLGSQVQTARKAAGHTQRSLADAVLVDEETIASIEQGRRSLLPDLARTLDEVLDTKGMLATGVENLPEIDQFPLYAEQYMVHEREAVALSWYDNAVLPGLLQTREYARAVLRQRVPAYDEDELETKVAARVERQDILHRKCPPTLSFIVWEPVLYLGIGGEKVHHDQLRRLRECAEFPGLPCSSCRCGRPRTRGWTAPSFSWRRPTTSTSPTPRVSEAASG